MTDYDAQRLSDVLAPFVDDLEAAAERSNDPADTDVYRCLAAFGRGQHAPRHAAQRVLERARGDRDDSPSTPVRDTTSADDAAGYCSSCGEGLDGGENYCPECGEALDG